MAPTLWPDEHFITRSTNDVHYQAGPDALWFITSSYVDPAGFVNGSSGT
ncbi:MAG: hypothetical protein GY790_09515 [Bacteroidetes bacterium]|nr:hypothetical protein [Bacteroidota bacterium]